MTHCTITSSHCLPVCSDSFNKQLEARGRYLLNWAYHMLLNARVSYLLRETAYLTWWWHETGQGLVLGIEVFFRLDNITLAYEVLMTP